MVVSRDGNGALEPQAASSRAPWAYPQWLHFRPASSLTQLSMIGLSCVPRSVHWNLTSFTSVGWSPCACLLGQYHRIASGLPSGLVRSTTMPTVFANRTGEWGVFADRTEMDRRLELARWLDCTSFPTQMVGILTRKHKHFAFSDRDVLKLAVFVNHLE